MQPLMFWTRKTVPLNVLSWKFLKSWRNRATLNVNPRPRIFGAEFVGVVDLRIELEVADQRLGAAGRPANGQDRRLERRPVEVEAARFVAARIAGVEQQVVVRLVGQHAGAGELALAALVVDRHAVELGRRIALAGQADEAARPCTGRRGTPGWPDRRTAEQRLVGRAGGVVVAERRVEPLALVGVAKADGEIELRRDVEDVVGEERPVAAVLVDRRPACCRDR